VQPPLAHDYAESGYERLLEGWLSGEMRLVNSGLPRERRFLSELLTNDRPSVSCADGSDQMFKRAELRFLEGLLNEEERAALLLPILIEMTGEETEAMVLCAGDVERKVVSSILGMDMNYERPGRIRLYRPQLSLLRKKLRTTTQYAFSARTGD
jgi:uncharacterized protein (UPF0216 family)